ncbi:MAG: putative lipopolysaccharide heptosyltransferase III [Proteobacteria bacterium]|nr:putative lipopolysaccharide heptosyltransferase III [Pseudomonadota bacterium]
MLKDAVPLDGLKRALVVKLRHHGDVLLASPVLAALKAAAPRLEIDALVYDDTAPMLAGHPALAQLHCVGRRWRDEGAMQRLGDEWRLFSALHARKFDLIVHLCEHPRGAWLARYLGARWAVAPAMPGRSKFWERSFTHLYPLPKNGRRHQVELNLDALRRIGLQPAQDGRRAQIVAGEAAESKVSALLAAEELGVRGFVHLHPASRWKFKCWPADKCAALIDRLSAAGERIVITAASDPAEAALVDDILKRTRAPVLNLAGTLSIKELVALIGRAKISVCVDSMPMHVASAVGTPVVALFGPSGEIEWGPWRVKSEVVVSDHPCRPCGNDGCGGGKVSECLTVLDVERVFGAAARLLASG